MSNLGYIGLVGGRSKTDVSSSYSKRWIAAIKVIILKKDCCRKETACVLFGLKFADNIHYKFKSSQASKARLQSSKHTGAKKN